MSISVEIYKTREELITAHPRESHVKWGPIHKHDGKLFVQVYTGQHNWVAISVDDTTERYYDPGWRGTEFGWGFVECDERFFECPPWTSDDIDAPEGSDFSVIGDPPGIKHRNTRNRETK